VATPRTLGAGEGEVYLGRSPLPRRSSRCIKNEKRIEGKRFRFNRIEDREKPKGFWPVEIPSSREDEGRAGPRPSQSRLGMRQG